VYTPKITTYLGRGTQVPTPSVRTGAAGDIYLTLGQGAAPGDTTAEVTVSLKPLIVWLWVGGAVMAIGTILAAFPGRRRRPTDPVGFGRSAARAEGDPPVDPDVVAHVDAAPGDDEVPESELTRA
jgi:cytochrome c-type biogenesis protein CcmF